MRPNFRRKFAPDSIHSDKQDGWAAYGYLNWGLAMGIAYPPDRKREFLDQQECFDESLPRDDEETDDERSDHVLSLLEENARLRGLVVKLTDLILKNVVDQK